MVSHHMNELSAGNKIESATGYFSAIRNSELKPTSIPTVYCDPEGMPWHVDDPTPMNPEQMRESFAMLQFRRGRGPKPF
jgi:hypothetical protein